MTWKVLALRTLAKTRHNAGRSLLARCYQTGYDETRIAVTDDETAFRWAASSQSGKTADPRRCMLRRFAKAIEVLVEELVADKVERRKGVALVFANRVNYGKRFRDPF